MDPNILSAITGGLVALASEVAKGTASEIGKDVWTEIKGVLGSKPEAAIDHAQAAVSERLEAEPAVMTKLLQLLQSSQSANVIHLVKHLKAENAGVIGINTGTVDIG